MIRVTSRPFLPRQENSSRISTIYPSDYMQVVGIVKGNKLRLVDREHLLPIYNSYTMYDDVLMFGRQAEKTTTLSNLLVVAATSHSDFYTLYIAPTNAQVKSFVKERLVPIYASNAILKNTFAKGRSLDSVFDIELTNGSWHHARSVYRTADPARGLSIDMLCVDEAQDVPYSQIAVVEETLSASPYKYKKYVGTPKSLNNTLAFLWKKSTQCEWIIRCTHCNKFNIIGLENIGLKGLVCSKCKKDIFACNGCWTETNPSHRIDCIEKGLVPRRGFRLPQLLSPNHKDLWPEILRKLSEYALADFYREILAIPYALSDKPLSYDIVAAACGNYPLYTEPQQELQSVNLYAGIDWGRELCGYTVLVIGGRVGNKFKVFYMKRFDGVESDFVTYMPIIEEICRRFNVRCIGADSGDGFAQNSVLRSKFGKERVYPFIACGNLAHKLVYNARTNCFHFNRSICMADVIMEIREKLINFPKLQYTEQFIEDFTSLTIEWSNNESRMAYGHDPSIPDDMFHALMYAELSCGIDQGYLDNDIGNQLPL